MLRAEDIAVLFRTLFWPHQTEAVSLVRLQCQVPECIRPSALGFSLVLMMRTVLDGAVADLKMGMGQHLKTSNAYLHES